MNILTQVFENSGPVNDILYTKGNIYLASNTRNILKYSTDGKLLSKFKTSSNCVFNLKKLSIADKEVI
jgi:hypothetical protein